MERRKTWQTTSGPNTIAIHGGETAAGDRPVILVIVVVYYRRYLLAPAVALHYGDQGGRVLR